MAELISLRISLTMYIFILVIYLWAAAFEGICLQELYFIEWTDPFRKC